MGVREILGTLGFTQQQLHRRVADQFAGLANGRQCIKTVFIELLLGSWQGLACCASLVWLKDCHEKAGMIAEFATANPYRQSSYWPEPLFRARLEALLAH